MTTKLTNEGWVGVLGGIGMMLIALLHLVAPKELEAMFLGIGGIIALFSAIILTEEVPEDGLDIKKEIDGAKHA